MLSTMTTKSNICETGINSTFGNAMIICNLLCWCVAFMLYIKTTLYIPDEAQNNRNRKKSVENCDPKIKFAMQRVIGSFKLVVHGVSKLNQSAPGQELKFSVSKIFSAAENFRYAMTKLDDEIKKIESKEKEEQLAMAQEDKT